MVDSKNIVVDDGRYKGPANGLSDDPCASITTKVSGTSTFRHC